MSATKLRHRVAFLLPIRTVARLGLSWRPYKLAHAAVSEAELSSTNYGGVCPPEYTPCWCWRGKDHDE